MANNNYISYKGTIVFFDDTKPFPKPLAGGAVFKRPNHISWRDVPQIIGEYSEELIVEETEDA